MSDDIICLNFGTTVENRCRIPLGIWVPKAAPPWHQRRRLHQHRCTGRPDRHHWACASQCQSSADQGTRNSPRWSMECKMEIKLVLGQRSVHHGCIQLGLKTVRSSIRSQAASPILPAPFCYALVYLGHFTTYSQTILSSLTATHCVGEHNVGNQKRPVLFWTSRKTPICK